jgi:hypothetical protein
VAEHCVDGEAGRVHAFTSLTIVGRR